MRTLEALNESANEAPLKHSCVIQDIHLDYVRIHICVIHHMMGIPKESSTRPSGHWMLNLLSIWNQSFMKSYAQIQINYRSLSSYYEKYTLTDIISWGSEKGLSVSVMSIHRLHCWKKLLQWTYAASRGPTLLTSPADSCMCNYGERAFNVVEINGP